MIDIDTLYDYESIDNFDVIGKINIGEIFYKTDESYEDIWRVDNIYPYGVNLKHVKTNKIKYVDFKTLVKNYIKIAPHGFIELAAIKIKEFNYWDLRVSILSYDQELKENKLLSSGLLLTPNIDREGKIQYNYMSNPLLDNSSFYP